MEKKQSSPITMNGRSIEVDVLNSHLLLPKYATNNFSFFSKFSLHWPMLVIRFASFFVRTTTAVVSLCMSLSASFPFLLHTSRLIRFRIQYCYVWFGRAFDRVNAEHCMQNCISFSCAKLDFFCFFFFFFFFKLHFSCYVIPHNSNFRS